jgi:hypothetical protein
MTAPEKPYVPFGRREQAIVLVPFLAMAAPLGFVVGGLDVVSAAIVEAIYLIGSGPGVLIVVLKARADRRRKS